MAVLTVTQVTLAGTLLGAVAAGAGGDSFPNDGYTFFYVKNASGASINVTFDAPGALPPDQANAFDPDVLKPVAAGAERCFGPFTDKARFNDANGRVNVTYSAVTTVTVAAVRVY
jgi:hypothetical protein